MRTHLAHAEARRAVLQLVHGSEGRLPIEELRERLYSHRHAADRAVRALTNQGSLFVHEIVTADRRGRPRVGLALVPAPEAARARPTLPRFSGGSLRAARLRAGVSGAALARELGVAESTVRWWERAPIVPPARGREILTALGELGSRSKAQRTLDGATGARLRAARAGAGWSQQRLAAALGVSQGTVANWEAGRGLTLANARRVYCLLRQIEPCPCLPPSRLRDLRARQGWSQAELALRAGVGVATIKRWEAGRTSVPSHRTELLKVLLERS